MAMDEADRRPEDELSRSSYDETVDSLVARVIGVALDAETLARVRRALGGLRGVRRLGRRPVGSVAGLPEGAAERIRDALELARLAWLEPDERGQVRGARDVYERFAALSAEPVEELWALFLDGANRVLGRERIGDGSATRVAATPAEVLTACLRARVSRFLLVHNHPSGVATPSRDDVAFTRSVLRAGKLLGIALVDHVVIGAGEWSSLRDGGLLPFAE